MCVSLLLTILNTTFSITFICAFLYICGGDTQVPSGHCGDQRTNGGSHFSTSTSWVPGNRIHVYWINSKNLRQPNHLASPVLSIFWRHQALLQSSSHFYILGLFFKTRFLCVAVAVLELTLLDQASNSEIHLPLPPKCWN